jgi:outer membrane biosynthesis protein TonB
MMSAREQFWLVAAVAIFAHAVLLLGFSGYGFFFGDPLETDGFPSVDRAALVVRLPEHQPTPPPRLGELEGDGESIASVDLPDLQQSPEPKAFDQAWTRQKPSFASPSQRQSEASSSAGVAGDAAAQPSPVSPPLGPSAPTGLTSLTGPKPTESTEPDVEATVSSDAPEKTAAVSPAQSGEAADSADGLPGKSPDPADAGPSDLDAFAQTEGAEFTRGGIKSATGREVRLVRPRVDLGFMAEATRLYGQKVQIKLWVVTADDGKPRQVQVLRSSGSDVIDDAVRLALYDSWFGGKQPDAFEFVVVLYR